MDRPELVATSARSETFAGITYHLDGELVPALTVELDGGKTVYFEHHILLWKHTGVTVGIRSMKGLAKRMLAGIQIFITEAGGSGQIAFSRDGAGQVVPLHLKPGEVIQVREHQFLAASGTVDYSFERVKGVSNILFGGSGFFIDTFSCPQGEGILWLHGYGNVFEKRLAAGEQIDVEPGAWLYKDSSVTMQTSMTRLSVGMLAGMNLVMNRFTGPGRIGLQSMYLNFETE
ncbi:MAG TPA: AIM24 family protein [Rectinemataceae bacterium]|nr:AIM24 family protein [Rectinemataceae bacterium]